MLIGMSVSVYQTFDNVRYRQYALVEGYKITKKIIVLLYKFNTVAWGSTNIYIPASHHRSAKQLYSNFVMVHLDINIDLSTLRLSDIRS